MKVLIDYDPSPRADRFLGTRLRKNIKGALELVGTSWVESMFAGPDIVHLLSPDDEARAHDARDEGAALVVSALYAEDDPTARFTVLSGDGTRSLKSKSERLLSEADAVLVPSEAARAALVSLGIEEGKIDVVTPGVNLARFDPRSDVEKIIFRRYFRLSEAQPYCLSVGTIDDEDKIEALSKIALLVPSVRFYYLGAAGKMPAKASYLHRKEKKLPHNLFLTPLIEDDVYRSGMIGARAYISFSSLSSDEIVVLEAFASKTPVLALGRPYWSNGLLDSKSYRCFQSIERLAKGIEMLSLEKKPTGIIEGYRLARSRSLKELGRELMGIYGRVLPRP